MWRATGYLSVLWRKRFVIWKPLKISWGGFSSTWLPILDFLLLNSFSGLSFPSWKVRRGKCFLPASKNQDEAQNIMNMKVFSELQTIKNVLILLTLLCGIMTKIELLLTVNFSGYQDVILWIVLLYFGTKITQCLSILPVHSAGRANGFPLDLQ